MYPYYVWLPSCLSILLFRMGPMISEQFYIFLVADPDKSLLPEQPGSTFLNCQL